MVSHLGSQRVSHISSSRCCPVANSELYDLPHPTISTPTAPACLRHSQASWGVHTCYREGLLSTPSVKPPPTQNRTLAPFEPRRAYRHCGRCATKVSIQLQPGVEPDCTCSYLSELRRCLSSPCCQHYSHCKTGINGEGVVPTKKQR